jgi:predicted nucleic acid-binding protein
VIFIDTGAFLARYLAKDQYHSPATAFWDALKARNEGLVTSNFVLDETATLSRKNPLPNKLSFLSKVLTHMPAKAQAQRSIQTISIPIPIPTGSRYPI